MEQPEQYQLTQMVNHTMVFIARRFLIPATLQFVFRLKIRQIRAFYNILRMASLISQRNRFRVDRVDKSVAAFHSVDDQIVYRYIRLL
jgi:hypothetical protein